MSHKRKSWREKLADNKGYPKVFQIDQTKSKRWGEGTFVIPAPMEVNDLMGRVPKGKLTTIDELRKTLAHQHKATIACPMPTRSRILSTFPSSSRPPMPERRAQRVPNSRGERYG